MICTCTYVRAVAPKLIDRNKEGYVVFGTLGSSEQQIETGQYSQVSGVVLDVCSDRCVIFVVTFIALGVQKYLEAMCKTSLCFSELTLLYRRETITIRRARMCCHGRHEFDPINRLLHARIPHAVKLPCLLFHTHIRIKEETLSTISMIVAVYWLLFDAVYLPWTQSQVRQILSH